MIYLEKPTLAALGVAVCIGARTAQLNPYCEYLSQITLVLSPCHPLVREHRKILQRNNLATENPIVMGA